MASKPAALKVAPAPAAAAAPGAEEPKKPKGKKGKLLLLLLVLILAGGGGGGWWWWTKQKNAAKDPKQAAQKAEPKKGPPQFVPLEQFTVNLQDESHERFLQVSMVIEISNVEATDSIKAYMPIIRNRVLMLLSSKRSNEISSVEGKQKLAEAIITEVRQPLPATAPGKGVEGVHFSTFVIQ